MNLDGFNTDFSNGEFDNEPTSVLQQIADTPFTVTKVKTGVAKSGNPYCIVWTEKEYDAGVNTAEEGQEDKYVTMKCKKFFVTIREPKQFFSDAENVEKINGGQTCGPIQISKIKFTAEEIKENKTLSGKSHYIIKKV